jgi:hypothetical protein
MFQTSVEGPHMSIRSFAASLALLMLPLLRPAAAQTNATDARLLVTVLDPSNALVPGATVTLTGLQDVTKQSPVAPLTSSEKGQALFADLVPGRYSIQASFPGFESGLLREVTLRRGENRHVIALSLQSIDETVNVGRGQDTASSRSASAFGLVMSDAEIATLSDDPAELQRQILDLAGPDAIIRVDSFEGAQLPPKSQIKSIHVTRDQFAAEAEQPGSTFVDIITQPGSGPLSGNANYQYRPTSLSGISQIAGVRQPESNRNFNATVGGTLLKDTSDFSISVYDQRQFTSPIFRQAGSPAQVLGIRQPSRTFQVNGLLNYALTRDQTLRVGIAAARQRQTNLGVGQYDGPERAFDTAFGGYQIRVQEAGPIGRRSFQNTRLILTHTYNSQQALTEAPTIVIQDGLSTGGAQVRGRTTQTNFNFNSDVDYIRGIHSWRGGVQVYGGWFDTNLESGYLGTYTFADQASFDAGQPLLYTRTIGSPRVEYFNAVSAFYFQDDIRVSKSLTFSPGVRYMLQTHVHDASALAPRFGTTWSPFASGRTSFRFSAGLFYWPMEMQRVYEQTLRLDGNHQQQVLIVNPSYPSPGSLTGLPPNKYVLGDFSLQRNVRYSAGIDHTFTPRIRANVLYAYWHQFDFWSGRNLNAPVNGVRPDPAFANILEAMTDGVIRRHDVTANVNVSMVAPTPANNQKRFSWKRLSLAATYGKIRAWQSGDGPFTPSPTGTLDTEWAPSPNDVPYRTTISLTSTQVRSLTVNASWNATAGGRYTLTTGLDDNQDGVLNDRPAGVPLRSLQMPPQSTVNLRVAYMFTTGSGPAGPPLPGAPRRYRVGVSLSATNLTNHANYGGYSGNLRSADFQTATLVLNPRRVDVGMTLGF